MFQPSRDFAVSPLGPGSSLADARSPGAREGARARVRSRGSQSEPLAVITDSRCQTAQCSSFPRRVAAPGFCCFSSHLLRFASAGAPSETSAPAAVRDRSNSVPPMRGGWSADRRTLSFGRACDARPPCPGATGTSLGAPPWRFSDADPRAGSRQWNRSRSDCPRQALMPGGRGPDLPRCGSRRSRGTPLLAPSFRIVSGRRPSMSEDANHIL